MQTEILYGPAYSMARVALAPREAIRVESGAMMSMSSDLEIETGTSGGFLHALKRSALGGESFFINTFTAQDGGGEVTLAPALPGDMLVLDLRDQEYLVQAGGFIACDTAVDIDTRWGGTRSFFGGDANFFMLRCRGIGQLILASYGALHHVKLAAGQRYTVDTGHIIAFSHEIGFDVRRVGGWKSTILGGEGLVVDLTGPGEAFLQTRSQPAFIAWLSHHMPTTEAS